MLQMTKKHRPLGQMENSVSLGVGVGVGVDAARVLVLLSQQHYGARQVAALTRGRVFERRTCGGRFPTFQALGGHRASHGRTTRARVHAAGSDAGAGRLCRLGLQPMEARGGTASPRVHGCPVCGIEFTVGQALGGHMRRHRAMADADGDARDAREATSVEADSAGGECTGGICLELHLALSENCAKCMTRNAGLGAAVQRVQRTLLFGCSL